MPQLERFNDLLQQLQFDIRVEVVIADLIQEAFEMEEISVTSNGLFKRNYHRDIEKFEEDELSESKKKKLSFIVNRAGLYDRLPEDVLHQPSENYNSSIKERVIGEIKIQNQLEKASRRFFLPFEHEFYRQRVKMEIEERRFLFETNSQLKDDLFDDLWGFPDFLNNYQKSELGLLMPVLHKFTGDFPLITFIMSVLTGDKIEIHASPPQTHYVDGQVGLGDISLGVDSLLGGDVSSMHSSVTIKVFVQEVKGITDYMAGGEKIKTYEFLGALLFPFDLDTKFDIDLSLALPSFILENETSYLGRLNYTTVI